MEWKKYDKFLGTFRNGECISKFNIWTPLRNIHINLTNNSIKALFPTFKSAMDNNKPLTLLISDNLRYRMFKIKASNRTPELYMVGYGNGIFTDYNPNKINSIKTNSVNLYFDWNNIPKVIKDMLGENECPSQK